LSIACPICKSWLCWISDCLRISLNTSSLNWIAYSFWIFWFFIILTLLRSFV
jgi:hypothetical protein